MTDRQSLLNTILENPEDDMARLVFADFIEEREHERAEFIRVQIELAFLLSQDHPNNEHNHMGSCAPLDAPYMSNYCELCNKEFALRLRERKYLLVGAILDNADFPLPAAESNGHVKYRRGFIESIACSSADWFAHHAEILASHPVREVRLTDVPEVEFRMLRPRKSAVYFSGFPSISGEMNHEARPSVWLPYLGREGLLKGHWPNIKFDLPYAPNIDDIFTSRGIAP